VRARYVFKRPHQVEQFQVADLFDPIQCSLTGEPGKKPDIIRGQLQRSPIRVIAAIPFPGNVGTGVRVGLDGIDTAVKKNVLYALFRLPMKKHKKLEQHSFSSEELKPGKAKIHDSRIENNKKTTSLI
jgi:hypothetical protein